jgi:hypothetical protein
MYTSHSSKFLKVGISEAWGSAKTKPRAYSLHTPHTSLSLSLFFTLPDYQIQNSSWISRNTSVWGKKMFKRTAFEEEVSLPAFLICRSDIV